MGPAEGGRALADRDVEKTQYQGAPCDESYVLDRDVVSLRLSPGGRCQRRLLPPWQQLLLRLGGAQPLLPSSATALLPSPSDARLLLLCTRLLCHNSCDGRRAGTGG